MSRRNEGDQGQPSTRRPGFVTDQHGRKWSASIDKKSGFPVGKIQPHGWRAPWLPPQGTRSFIFTTDNPAVFRINYEWLLEERMQAAKDLDDDRTRKALVRGWDPTDPEKQDALDAIAGRRDGLQHPEVIVACMQGDPWTLGLTDVVNPKVAKFIPQKVDRRQALLSKFPDFTADPQLEEHMDLEEAHDPESPQDGRVAKPKHSYQDFVKAKRREGLDMAAIGAAWKAQKKTAEVAA